MKIQTEGGVTGKRKNGRTHDSTEGGETQTIGEAAKEEKKGTRIGNLGENCLQKQKPDDDGNS